MQAHGVSAVILAAGLSTRFGGSHKALRDLAGKTFMERLIEACRNGGVHDIIVVTGHQAEACSALAARLGVKTAYNENFSEGMFSSIQTGLRAALRQRPKNRAVLLAPVDAALLMPRSVAAILEAWRAQKGGPWAESIIVAAMNGRTGHPVLIPAAHLPAVLARPASGAPAPGDPPGTPPGMHGYYHALLAHNTRPDEEIHLNFMHPAAQAGAGGQNHRPILRLPLPDAGVLSDLDTGEDSLAAENFFELTAGRTVPSVEEAWQLLNLSGLGAKKIRHSLLVARGSLRLGLRMLGKGLPARPLLYLGAGLLHDLLRLESEHAVRAAEFIGKLGWPKTAFLVGCHTRLPGAYLARLGLRTDDEKFGTMPIPAEAERDQALGDELFYGALAVYMADKYARRDHLGGITERFADIRGWFRNDPEAIDGIDERERVVRALEKRFGAFLDCDLLELVSAPSGHPLEKSLDDAARPEHLTAGCPPRGE